MKQVFMIFLILFSIDMNAQNVNQKKIKESRPESIEKALLVLDEAISNEYKTSIKEIHEELFLQEFKRFYGDILEKKWLNGTIFQTKLAFEFKNKGLHDQNEMIKIILRSYYRKLKNVDINIGTQIEKSNSYLKNRNNISWFENYKDNYFREFTNANKVGDTISISIPYKFDFMKGFTDKSVISAQILEVQKAKFFLKLISIEKETDKELILKAANINDENGFWFEPYNWIEL